MSVILDGLMVTWRSAFQRPTRRANAAVAVAGPAPRVLRFSLLFPAAALLGLAEALYPPTADALPLILASIGLAGRYTALDQMSATKRQIKLVAESTRISALTLGALSRHPHFSSVHRARFSRSRTRANLLMRRVGRYRRLNG